MSNETDVNPYRGTLVEEPGDGPMYIPAPNERQLTFRAVFIGCVFGAAVSMMNIRFGLMTGWSVGGSLISAILAFPILAMVGRLSGGGDANAATPLENNIAQTAGSAAGSMTSAAGLLSSIPALQMLAAEGKIDVELGYFELTFWAGSIAWLGVFIAVPLRRQMVIIERLRFPSGTATASTITAMFSSGADAILKARVLVGFSMLAAAHVVLAHFVPEVGMLPLDTWLPGTLFAVLATYGFKLLISPLMAGAGILIGFRVGVSLLLGAILAWGIIAPMVSSYGWVEDPEAIMSYGKGARGWILWPGVAIMVADALTSLALSWRSVLSTFKGGGEGAAIEEDPEEVPGMWWMGGIAASTVLTISATWYLFNIPPWMSLLAVALSSVLAAIAVRSTGETDINPTGAMGKVTQLVYGAVAPGQMATNLMTAGVSSAGASQAGDMMHDLKAGWLLGASPRQQILAQLMGVTVGIFTCVPVYMAFASTGKLGSEEYPAPAAMAWKAMAELLARGPEALPENAVPAVIAGLIFGAAVPLARRLLKWTWLPSGLAMGIAFIVPAYYSVAMFLGALAFLAWEKSSPVTAKMLGFSVASGLIAGDGLMGVAVVIVEAAFGG